MLVETVLKQADLDPQKHCLNRTVVVFDVLRATTTMTAALEAGVREIRIFNQLDLVRNAAASFSGPRILCGESKCLPPEGFDLGNSPGAFGRSHAGQVVFMCTTNGTRAIVAAQEAKTILIGALVNAGAVAEKLHQMQQDITLLCAGVESEIAIEDVLGAGAVIDGLLSRGSITMESDASPIALQLFRSLRNELPAVLSAARGGKNVLAAGLAPDIDFAARLNVFSTVGIVRTSPLRVEKL